MSIFFPGVLLQNARYPLQKSLESGKSDLEDCFGIIFCDCSDYQRPSLKQALVMYGDVGIERLVRLVN